MKYKLFSTVFLIILLFLSFDCSSKKKAEKSTKPTTQRQELPAGTLQYTPPADWVAEHPGSRMRRGQYRLPGVNGKEDAVLAVYNFPGGGGSVEANLQRWYGQIKQPDGSKTETHVQRKDFTVHKLPVTVVYVTGTYLQSASGMMMGGDVQEKPGYAMWAAIVETADSPWFFKATGPKETVDKYQADFDEFVKTFRVENKQPS